jgi:hypothetical protein
MEKAQGIGRKMKKLGAKTIIVSEDQLPVFCSIQFYSL